MTDLARVDGLAQAEMVRTGDISPVELLEATLRRIEAVNPEVNAVVRTMEDEAHRVVSGDLPDGPFRGVPFLLKDAVCHSAGDPFHAGMRVLKEAGYVAPDDTWLAARFRAAGVPCAPINGYAEALGDPSDRSMGRLLGDLHLTAVPAPWRATADIDTPEDLQRWTS